VHVRVLDRTAPKERPMFCHVTQCRRLV